MSKRNGWAMGMLVAVVAPVAFGASKPTQTHVVGSDGSVFYADRAARSVVRVSPDGTSQIVAKNLDAPTGVALDENGNLLIGDEVGIRRVLLEEGVIQTIRVLPSEFEPSVSFDQPAWVYRKAKNTVKVLFSHNLAGQGATFTVEVSRNGGASWQIAAKGLKVPAYTFQRTSDDVEEERTLTTFRFRVTAYVDGQAVASDVSDLFDDPTLGRSE